MEAPEKIYLSDFMLTEHRHNFTNKYDGVSKISYTRSDTIAGLRECVKTRDAYIKFLLRQGVQGVGKEWLKEGIDLCNQMDAADAALSPASDEGVKP